MKKKVLCAVLLIGIFSNAFACPLCNEEVKDAIYNSRFYPNLLLMLSAFIVLSVIVGVLVALTNKRYRNTVAANPNLKVLSPVPLFTASIILGIGFGGFIDGIVLHQIFQVHEMLSNKIPATNYIGKSVNMFWDGIFHAFCLIVTLIGVMLLWKLMLREDVDRSGKLLASGLLAGWGLFNIVEGVIDHHLLALHNVIEYAPDHDSGNYTFLGISVCMLVFAWLLMRNKKKPVQINDRMK